MWLKDAGWGGAKPWRSDTSGDHDDAHTRAGLLESGETLPNALVFLSDSSVHGDWRLPTKTELQVLTTDPQGILTANPGPFSGVQPSRYWSSTSDAGYASNAWFLDLYVGFVSITAKSSTYYVWPVRGGQ